VNALIIPEQQIKQLSNEMSQAIAASDTAILNRGWADDYRFTNERGDVITKAQLLEVIQSGVLKYESVVNDDIDVRVYGDAAVMTGNTSVRWQFAGESLNGRYRFTEVYVNGGDGWRAVAGHISRKNSEEG
jgi:ketosteroid isomerase-like protein